MGEPRSKAGQWLLIPALLMTLTSCALVPTGGPVLEGRAVEPVDPGRDPYVRIIPEGPQPGETPPQIVRGFLAASASFQYEQQVARQYLAGPVRSEWNPRKKVEVYRDGPALNVTVQRASKHDAVVTVTSKHVATINGRGQYTAAPAGERFEVTFRLRNINDQWRIVSFPPGLLLTNHDVARAYRTYNLYFFDPGMHVLVPNPVYVPAAAGERLPTELTRALIRGATDSLARAVQNAFPEGARLVEPVRVTAGVATVKLGRSAGKASMRALSYMSAQLAWTLSQLPDVESVRVKVRGNVVSVPGAGELVSTDDWSSLDPDATAGMLHGYVVRDETLLVTGQDGLESAAGPAGSGDVRVHNPAISLNGKRAAWLSPNGRELSVGALREGGTYQHVFTGKRLLSLSWDLYGNLWTVETEAKGSTVWMLVNGTDPVQVAAPELDSEKVRVLKVARDGTRVAAVVGRGSSSRLLLGRIERADGAARIAGLMPLPTGLARVTDVAWRASDELVVLGKDVQGVFAPYIVPVDGTTVSPTGSVEEMASIAAAPGVPMLVGLRSGEVWQSHDDLGWQRLAGGAEPVYPG